MGRWDREKARSRGAPPQLLGYVYVDTGAMYRAVALKALRHGVPLDSSRSVDRRWPRKTQIDLRAEEDGSACCSTARM